MKGLPVWYLYLYLVQNGQLLSPAEFGLNLQREPEFDHAMPPSQGRSKQQFRTIQDGRRELCHNLGLLNGKFTVVASYPKKLTDSK